MKYIDIYDCLFLAVTAWVYVRILTNDGEILGWWSKLLENNIDSDYILKPIVRCEYCVGGQLALWFYLISNFNEYKFLSHFFTIIGTIFLVRIINLIIEGNGIKEN